MASLIRNKLKGTILEPMFALMIIMLSLTASFIVVMKANQGMNIMQTTRASVGAGEVMTRIISEENFISETITYEGLRIEKESEWYNEECGLLKIKILVFDNKNRNLFTQTRVIIASEGYE